MVRVLYLANSLARGGAEQLLVSVTRHLNKERYTGAIGYIAHREPNVIAEIEETGWPVISLGHDRRDPRWLGRLHRLLRADRADIVHCHSPVVGTAARLLLPRHPQLPMVYTEHNEWHCYHPLTYWANALTYSRNDMVLAVSAATLRSASRSLPMRVLPKPPMETLHHGIDVERVARTATSLDRAHLGIPENVTILGTVANFRPEKDHETLLDAACIVWQHRQDVRFVLVGAGPTEASVRTMVAERGLGNAVVFAGYHSDATRVARLFDVFILSSRVEGLPIAPIEAMALGKPVIATAAGGIPEVVQDGRQGFVVPVGDADALAGAVLRLLDDSLLRCRMAQEAVERARDFDIRRSVARLESVYDRVLGADRATS